ncbi:MAG: hypothetical protein NC253_11015 [Ruminococcus sp.]|nr:hypothetical protein [Ruminococcus sp.]MCM1478804.1 hypothetical protein [Muribaculaceae bacterium]
MKNILKSTAIFAACLALTACGDGYGETPVQSITEPPAVQQTVQRTVEQTETTAGTVKSFPDDWEETVAAEAGDPETVTEAYTGVTFPETMDDWEHAYVIKDLFFIGLQDLSYAAAEPGSSDYHECEECYKRLLVEKFLDYPDNFGYFGGAYWSGGRLVLKITDLSKSEEIFADFFDGLESVDIEGCDYSYQNLADVHKTVEGNEKVNLHFINVEKNRVEVGGELTEDDVEEIRAELENAGLDPNAAEFSFSEDCPVANPC